MGNLFYEREKAGRYFKRPALLSNSFIGFQFKNYVSFLP